MSTPRFGRENTAGDNHRTAKLSWDIVRQMRREHKAGATPTELAARYGITSYHATRIVQYKAWWEPREDEDGGHASA